MKILRNYWIDIEKMIWLSFCFTFRNDHITRDAEVVFKRSKHHKGSIYCVAWNATGDLIATGSNDKTIKMIRYDSESHTSLGELEQSWNVCPVLL